MKFIPTKLPGMVVIEPDVHRDERGFFLESFQAKKYAAAGMALPFVQHNHSKSVKGTLRGLHAQKDHPQGKLVRVLRGEIYDVGVDVRVGSPTFGKWDGVLLSAENFKQIYVPTGFIHGFVVVSEEAEVEYKCTDFYAPSDEFGVIWNDPDIGIQWPVKAPLLSKKDGLLPRLADIKDRLPRY